MSFVLGFVLGAVAGMFWVAYRVVRMGQSGHLRQVLEKRGLL